MQIRSAPISDGVRWVTAGLRLFGRQPLGLTAMTVFFFFMHVLAVIPVIGPIVAALLSPFATLGLMAAFREVAAGRVPTPLVFANVFRSAEPRRQLLRLGAANAVLIVAIGLVLQLINAGEYVTAGDASAIPRPDWDNAAWQLLPLLPVAVLMWFAPMLAGWHGAGPAKAMFGSAIACWRNKMAMLMYVLAIGAVLMVVAMALGALVTALGVSTQATSLIIAPVVLAALTVVQAGIYVMYETVFGDRLQSPA